MKINLLLCFNIIFLLFISCENSEKNEKINIKENHDAFIDFPTNVVYNKDTKGTTKYNLSLDTIKESDIIERFIFLYVSTDNMKEFNVEEIEKLNHKIFIDTTNQGFFNFKAQFNELGERRLNLIIQDVILLKNKDTSYPMIEYIREWYYGKNVQVLNDSLFQKDN